MKSIEALTAVAPGGIGTAFCKRTSQFAAVLARSFSRFLLPGPALIFLASSLQAATWYVDGSVSSSGDGRSWSTAWKSLSNVSGVGAGDTVYISGGPSGT